MIKAIFCLILYFQVSYSQNLTFYGFLPSINQTGKISKKLNYNVFISTTIDAFNEVKNSIEYPATDLQFYVQPSVIYIYSESLSFATSYTYQRNNPFNNNYINEHRLWQQISVRRHQINNRVRLEERFIENKLNHSYPLSTRLRYQIGYSKPLQGSSLEKNEIYFNTYNEFYFSLTGSKNAIFSENWSYLGIGYETGKTGRIEMGYLLQSAVRNKSKDIRFLNLLQVTWITNFNFK